MFQNEIEYNKLGLIVIDEQHRFGVAQRAELKNLGIKSHNNTQRNNESTAQKLNTSTPQQINESTNQRINESTTKITPHILVMTATPIPRTLSMTIYGDLDVSIIREMPKNRKPIITKVTFDSRLPDVYDFIRKEIHKGHQAFIVYPLVDVSEKLELKAATEHYERLRTEVFPDFSCGLLHGQMFWYEKDDSMKAFLNKEYQILVATTVIEVGIDIPNATIMMIENAERFGLSQLHQLRGRIGRGPDQSYCILVTKDQYQFVMRKNVNIEEERTSAIIRLKTMADTLDGFKIAEVDMQLRGPGDILGTRQSGLPDFKYLDLITDGDIITQARHEAFKIIEEDPHLRKPENISLRKEYLKRFGADRSFLDVA
jgi:ATP-dependent DNA helicase RecG